MAEMDRLTLASIAAQKAGLSYGQYMASLYRPPVVETEVEPEKRVCRTCGKEISKYAHGNRRYCSNYCQYERTKGYYREKYHEMNGHPEEDRPKRVCCVCGKKIPKHMHGGNRYCSEECRHERQLERDRAKYQENKDQINAKRTAKRKAKKDGEI